MIKIERTCICDICRHEEKEEFKLATYDTPMLELKIPEGWSITLPDKKMICNKHKVKIIVDDNATEVENKY